jgi:F-type H+-transporting ATPase subunit delta
MPITNPEVQSYAEALVALGQATGLLARFEREAPSIADFLASHGTVRDFLARPAISTEGKAQALERLLQADVHPVLLRFLQILQDRNRLDVWPSVAVAFAAQAASLRGAADGDLVSAAPLSDAQAAEIEREVSRILDKKVRLLRRVDPALVGGVVVRVGSLVLDGSVDSQLDKLGRDLLSAGDSPREAKGVS